MEQDAVVIGRDPCCARAVPRSAARPGRRRLTGPQIDPGIRFGLQGTGRRHGGGARRHRARNRAGQQGGGGRASSRHRRGARGEPVLQIGHAVAVAIAIAVGAGGVEAMRSLPCIGHAVAVADRVRRRPRRDRASRRPPPGCRYGGRCGCGRLRRCARRRCRAARRRPRQHMIDRARRGIGGDGRDLGRAGEPIGFGNAAADQRPGIGRHAPFMLLPANQARASRLFSRKASAPVLSGPAR